MRQRNPYRIPAHKVATEFPILIKQGWYLKSLFNTVSKVSPKEFPAFMRQIKRRTYLKLSYVNLFKSPAPHSFKNLIPITKISKKINTFNLNLHSGDDFPIDVISSLTGLKYLTSLTLDLSRTFFKPNFYDIIIQKIGSLRLLTSLDLSLKKCYHLSNATILSGLTKSFSKVRGLQSLKLNVNNLGGNRAEPFEDFFLHLRSLKKLKELYLGVEFCKISIKAFENLIATINVLPKLTSLNLGVSLIEVKNLGRNVANQEKLQLQNVTNLTLTARGRYHDSLIRKFLGGFLRLNQLNLDFGYSKIENEDLKKLSNYFESFKHLSHLEMDLSRCDQITEAGLTDFFNALSSLGNLKGLSLKLCHFQKPKIFTPRAMRALGSCVLCLINLHSLALTLGESSVVRETFISLSDWIKFLGNLHELHLNIEKSHECTDETFLSIIKAFSHLKSLIIFNFGFQYCTLNDESLQVFAEVLLLLPSLEVLHVNFLNYENFSERGIEKFCEVLSSMKRLKNVTKEFVPKQKRGIGSKKREYILLGLSVLIPVIAFMACAWYFYVYIYDKGLLNRRYL